MAKKKKKVEEEEDYKYVTNIGKLIMKKGSIFQSGTPQPPPRPPK